MHEALMHDTGLPSFSLDLDHPGSSARTQAGARDRRHLPPETERASHYFYADLRRQFNLLLHFEPDPRGRTAGTWGSLGAGEVPETFPFGVDDFGPPCPLHPHPSEAGESTRIAGSSPNSHVPRPLRPWHGSSHFESTKPTRCRRPQRRRVRGRCFSTPYTEEEAAKCSRESPLQH